MGKLRRLGGRFEYLNQIGSQALQEICERHDKAYQAFFKWVKNGGPKRLPPKFKKIIKYKSFTLKQAGWKLLDGNKIRIGNYVYKFSKSREISGTIKTVTVKRDLLGRFWVCFSVEQEIEINQVSTGEIGGFDFGLKTYLVDHAGKRYESPEFFKQRMANIARCNRALARKQKGSHGRQKAKRTLTKAHERIANQRNDWQWKLAYQLTDRFEVLCFEDLNLDGMKRLWGRKVSDLAFNDFLHKVIHHCKLKGKMFVQVDRWEPTTQCCSQCHHRQKLSLNERSFNCKQCGMVMDRDQNAAINIQAGGASSAGLGDVRRSMTAIPA